MLTRYKFFIIGLLVSLTLWLAAAFSVALPSQAQVAEDSKASVAESEVPTQATAVEKAPEKAATTTSNSEEKAGSSQTEATSQPESADQTAPNAQEQVQTEKAVSAPQEISPDQEAAQSLKELNAELQKGKTKTINLEMDKKPRLSILQSSNPEDYKRLSGIWISDTGNGRIVYMKNLRGEDFYPLGLSGSGLGRFLNPEQIWVDVTGKIYIADRGNNRIIRLDDIRGLGWTEMNNGFNGPRGVAFHGKRLYISDTDNDRILVYEKFGDTTPMAELKDDKIKQPGYLWLDMEGNLYVCCGEGSMRGQIVRIPFDLTALPSTWTIYRGQGLSGATFTPTQFLKTDDGLFFVDTANQRLVKTDNFKGKNPLEIGSYGRGSFQFLEPKGLSCSEDGSKIYIADTGNDRIVCLDPKQASSWEVYDSLEPTFGLRSPKCVFVWSPRPLPEEDDKDKDEDKDKDK